MTMLVITISYVEDKIMKLSSSSETPLLFILFSLQRLVTPVPNVPALVQLFRKLFV
jgi:hypothetical protein